MHYAIGKFAKLTGLTPHTLRYYEKEGLLTATRNRGGHRIYLEADLRWVEFIKRLKETGMPIKEIKIYAGLRARGNKTLQARLEMLQLHRRHILDEIAAWEENLKNIDKKIEYYLKEIEANS